MSKRKYPTNICEERKQLVADLKDEVIRVKVEYYHSRLDAIIHQLDLIILEIEADIRRRNELNAGEVNHETLP